LETASRKASMGLLLAASLLPSLLRPPFPFAPQPLPHARPASTAHARSVVHAHMLAPYQNDAPIPDEIEGVFRGYGGYLPSDSRLQGGLAASQLRGALLELDCDVDSSTAASLLRKYDQDNSGYIELPELAQLVNSLITPDVWAAFRASDPEGSGRLGVAATQGALHRLGYEVDIATVGRLLSRYDHNENGWLELLGFSSLVSTLAPRGVWTAFREVDADRTRRLDLDQLKAALLALDYRCASDEEASRLLRRYDEDGDAKLDLREFSRLVARLTRPRVVRVFVTHARMGVDGVDAQQLRTALSDLGLRVSDTEAEELLRDHDVNQTGQLELLGFASAVSHIVRQRVWWRRLHFRLIGRF